jgi:hypothetical protein
VAGKCKQQMTGGGGRRPGAGDAASLHLADQATDIFRAGRGAAGKRELDERSR